MLANDGQPGSYLFVRRIGTEKRASSDRPIAGEKRTSRYRSAYPELDYFRIAYNAGEIEILLVVQFDF